MGRDIGAAVRAAPNKEYLVAEWYRHLGYQAHQAKPSKVRRGHIWITQSNDLWESIDVAAMLEDEDYPEEYRDVDMPWLPEDFFAFEFAQVCTPNGVYVHKRKIEEQKWPLRQLNLSYRVTIWAYRRNEFRVLEWHGGRDWREWPKHIKL